MLHIPFFIWVSTLVPFWVFLLCGYIGETVNWHYGFGLAGIFMLFGMLQFHFGQKIFGDIGLSIQ